MKIQGFEIFEAIRDKQKGETMIGIHKSLNPMLVKEQAGTELGQAQIRLELGFISIKICCPKLINITKDCY